MSSLHIHEQTINCYDNNIKEHLAMCYTGSAYTCIVVTLKHTCIVLIGSRASDSLAMYMC